MKEFIVFAITRNSDNDSGEGHTMDTGIYFTKNSDAIEFCESNRYKEYAVQGYVNKEYAKYNVEEKTLRIFSDLDDYDAMGVFAKKEDKRKELLNRLTAEERNILGLQ
jgi:hypothetical protein